MKVINKVEFNNIYNDIEIGQAYWYVIHTFAIRYPYKPTIDDRRKWELFFNLLENLLPCESCRKYYQAFQEQHPLQNYLDNTLSLFKWTFLLHNFVNDKLNKIFTIEMKKAFNIYYHNGFESDKFVQFLLLIAINFEVFSQRVNITKQEYLKFIEICLSIIPENDAERIGSKVFPACYNNFNKKHLIRQIISCFKNYWTWFKKYIKVYSSTEYKYRCDQCTIECCTIQDED